MKPTILLVMILSIVACNPPQNLGNASDAKFIFRATVEQVRAATLTEITDVTNCIVVKVNEVVSAPPGFDDWTGRSITVSVKDIGQQKPGTEQLFYTNGWLYGKSLAVVELSSRNSKEVSNEQVISELDANQDKKVRERLKSSELVIAGKVIKISNPEKLKVDTEHDPYWSIAEIQISSVEKGKWESKTISIQFAASRDVMWERSPKFKVGDEGIWLLRRKPNQENQYSITEQEDFYPIERLAYLRSLLK